MAPLPSSAPVTTLGGNEGALQINTLLAFGAIMFAAMQGTLCMESADPCRISYQKLRFLVGLEVLEVIVVVASESMSVVQMRGPLRKRLTWLQWVPTCLLTLGLMELALDVVFTLSCAARSRINWEPLSSVGYVEDKSQFNAQFLLELAPLLLTGCMSLILVGWRQEWWMAAEAVDSTVAMEAARRAGALSAGAIGFCFGWGFFLNGLLLIGIFSVIIAEKHHKQWRYMFNPKECWLRLAVEKHLFGELNDWNKRSERFDKLYEIQYGSNALQNLSHEDRIRSIGTSPSCMGNAIVGDDSATIYSFAGFRFTHFFFLFAEHFTILPLQLCTVIGLFQVHTKLDAATLAAMKQVVDAVVVIAFVEIAKGLKSFLWGAGAVGELHEKDKRIGDP